MNPSGETKRTTFAGYRTRLLVSMMLLVTIVTGLALLYAQRNVAAAARRDLEREFRFEFAALRAVQEIRHAALAERCRALARKPRLHAALEDNALDLLYPSARDELLDVMSGPEDMSAASDSGFRARFYRFLDAHGHLIAPAAADDVPPLAPAVETRLALPAAPTKVQTGYLFHAGSEPTSVDEIIAMPIFSTETGAPIATLVVGFAPFEPPAARSRAGVVRGIWSAGQFSLPSLAPQDARILADQLALHLTGANPPEGSVPVEGVGVPSLLFYKELNPGSSYPPAFEIGLYPLTELMITQRHLTWRFAGAGGLLLFAALGLSRWLAQRLSAPVERLAVDSAANFAGRRRAEAALETTHEELQRSARFSADASHQLKTPVTVLRIGLEELLARERLSLEAREEISGLVHQTFRLTSLIEDLLLLSRMDAGRLQLELGRVDLKQLIDASLDDLGALPDDAGVAVETTLPAHLPVVGERRYTSLILQNLLENARKYNRPGGRIRVSATVQAPWVTVTIGNNGLPIPPAAQQHVFERFHRGTMAENLPGHGLGLNLARQLARLHLGELRLVRSESDWTEFEVRFQLADPSLSAAS